MKRYNSYKNSHVEWIGNMPRHWSVKKLKYLAEIVLGKMLTNDDKGGYFNKPYLRAQNVDWLKVNTADIKQMWFSEQELKQYRVQLNDLLICEGGEVGRTAIWNNEIHKCYIQNSIHKVTMQQRNNPFYFLYLFFFYGHVGYFDSIVSRVSISHLTREKLKEVICLVPPIVEQSAIVSYLDSKTAQIEDLIAKKQRLIELLKEERTAIINQAVTKGINPHVKMEDSGIGWLGEIPEHWEIMKLKYLVVKINSGVTPRGGASVYQQEGIPLIRSQNVYFDGLKLDDVAFIPEEIHREMSGSKVLPGDVLLNITGASIGRCCTVPDDIGEANVNQHVCILRPRQMINSCFLCNYLASEKGQIQIFSNEKGISREGLNYEQIKSFLVPVLPKKEQQDIADYITNKNKEFSKVIFKIQREIELLQEYRTSLISEIITGKIDVRDEVVA